MTVSTSVIVAITVLGCCLIITSALLVYKLRPDVQQFSSKWSGYCSEPPSPVRKMTVVRGLVVEDNLKRPSRAFLPRWSTLYTSRRSSTASSFGSHTSLILASTMDLEAQLDSTNEKIPRADVQEYLGFEKSRRARKTRQPRTKSMKIPPPITLRHDSFSTDDELRVSPDAFSPKKFPLSAPAALSHEGNPRDSTTAPPAAGSNEPARRHSTPASVLLNMPQTRGALNAAFLQAASISALPPTAYSARTTPEPSIRFSMPEIADVDKIQNAEPPSFVYPDQRIQEEDLRTSRQVSRDLETIIETTSGSEIAAAPSPVVSPLPRHLRPKSQSSSRFISRKIKEGSLLQRLGRNRPPPIRVAADTNMNGFPVVNGFPPSQSTPGNGPDMRVTNPVTNASAPITPPVLSANIVNGIPSYPAFISSAARNRQSTTTIGSSQYSPTFSLASVQRVPLFAGKLSPLGAHASLPNVPLVAPSSGIIQPTPVSSHKNAAGLRKSRESSVPADVSAFPKPPSSLRNSPLSSAFSPPPLPPGKRVHGVSPLVNGNIIPMPAAKPASAITTNLQQDRPRRPSRYSHLIDKDLPAPPPTSTVVATLLGTHQRKSVPSISQEIQMPKRRLPLPQSPQPLPLETQRIANGTLPLVQASSFQQIPQPFSLPVRHTSNQILPSALSSVVQQIHSPLQEPKPPLIPHVRSQSLSSKASSETQQLNMRPTTATSAKHHAYSDSALASSPTISVLEAPGTVSSTTSLVNKPLPIELQYNLDLNFSGGSELGLDFRRGAFGS